MAMRSTLEDHPDRQKIDQEIAAGRTSLRSIAKKYRVSSAAILRYAHGKVPAALEKAAANREAADAMTAETVMTDIREQQAKVRRWMAAAEKELTVDGELCFSPRAREMDAVWEEQIEDVSGRTRVRQKRGSLQDAIDQGRGLVSVHVRSDDTRSLLVKISAELRAYQEHVSKVFGMVQPPQTNIQVNNYASGGGLTRQEFYDFAAELGSWMRSHHPEIADEFFDWMEARGRGEAEKGIPAGNDPLLLPVEKDARGRP